MKTKTKQIKAWMIVDLQKKAMRPCYAKRAGTKDHANGLMACYFKEPVIAPAWKPFKKAVRVTITLPSQSTK